ncbi:MAG: ABC transporter substrate-binding protein [Paracoccus sp. (in: a-proteobacteria)]|uniref:ABC transporter substrate-binding protein n=1 Tax=Paracoccus sp. TaxID=267 RepID=UPI0039E3619C
MKTKWRGGTSVLAVAAFCFSAAMAQEPVRGGALTLAIFAEPTSLMPLSSDINVQIISAQLYPALLKFDSRIEPKPYLAREWRVLDGGATYEFDLVQGAKWSDGTPITSADVKFSFEEMILKYHSAGKANFGVIDSIDASDPARVVFRLKRPYAPFLQLVNSFYAPILPRQVYEGTDPLKNQNSQTAAVTGGPFRIKEWVKGDHLTLERNPDAFDSPWLDAVNIRFIPDASARMLALKTGAVDYLPPSAMPYGSLAMLEGDSNISLRQIGDEAAGKVLTIGFNLRRAPFDDVRVRRAISHAVNSQFIADAVSFKHETPAVGPLNAGSWGWDTSLKGYAHDPELAGKMLDEAGYPVKEDGFRFAMQINTRTSVAVFHKANEILVQNLRAVGIDAKLRPLESAPYTASTYIDADFDLSSVAWISAFDPNNLRPLYSCDSIRPAPYSNFMGYCNNEVDALLEKGAAESDTAKRKAIYVEMQQKIIDDAPAIWPMNWSDWSAARVHVQGLPAGPWDGRDPMDDLWVEAK